MTHDGTHSPASHPVNLQVALLSHHSWHVAFRDLGSFSLFLLLSLQTLGLTGLTSREDTIESPTNGRRAQGWCAGGDRRSGYRRRDQRHGQGIFQGVRFSMKCFDLEKLRAGCFMGAALV